MRCNIFLSALLVPAATAFEYHTLLESILDDYSKALAFKKQDKPDVGCKEYLQSATSVRPTAWPAITAALTDDKVAGNCPMTAAYEVQDDLTNYSKTMNVWAKSVIDDLYKYSLCGFDAEVPSPTPSKDCPLVFVHATDVPVITSAATSKGPKETGKAKAKEEDKAVGDDTKVEEEHKKDEL